MPIKFPLPRRGAPFQQIQNWLKKPFDVVQAPKLQAFTTRLGSRMQNARPKPLRLAWRNFYPVIVNSWYEVASPQVDGRSYVTEHHTDNAGVTKVLEYLAQPGADYVTIMAARVLVINGGVEVSTEQESAKAVASARLTALLAAANTAGTFIIDESVLLGGTDNYVLLGGR